MDARPTVRKEGNDGPPEAAATGDRVRVHAHDTSTLPVACGEPARFPDPADRPAPPVCYRCAGCLGAPEAHETFAAAGRGFGAQPAACATGAGA